MLLGGFLCNSVLFLFEKVQPNCSGIVRLGQLASLLVQGLESLGSPRSVSAQLLPLTLDLGGSGVDQSIGILLGEACMVPLLQDLGLDHIDRIRPLLALGQASICPQARENRGIRCHGD